MEFPKRKHPTPGRANIFITKSDALKYILLLIFLPVISSAQVMSPVQPITSNDYTEQIRKLKGRKDPVDSVSNQRNTVLNLKGRFDPSLPIYKMKTTQDHLEIFPGITKSLYIAGSYSSNVEVRTVNKQPALQNSFAQGRSLNGTLTWQGPETGEMFSYGPAVKLLEFDGAAYLYDQNGKLTSPGTGNGNKARTYDNSIFRTASYLSQSLHLQGDLYRYGKRTWNFSMKMGHKGENTVMRENKNTTSSIGAGIGTSIKWVNLSGNYNYVRNRFSNGNRNGFLSRVYQYSLLTPITFDNAQGTMIGATQRSYSNTADNPRFLLEDNDNSYRWSQHTGSLTTKLKTERLDARVIQSIQYIHEENKEIYKPGTTGWEDGMITNRKRNDRNYTLQSNASYRIDYNNDQWSSLVSASYLYTDAHSSIHYAPAGNRYSYQRSLHDASLHLMTTLNKHPIVLKLEAGNSIFISNTATTSHYLLPTINAIFELDGLSGLRNFQMYINTMFRQFKSELPIDKSLAHINLLRYSSAQAFLYQPVQEVTGFDGVAPIDHKEWTTNIRVNYHKGYFLSSNIFVRKVQGDVFPVYENGQLQLRNIADHRNSGFEITLGRSYATLGSLTTSGHVSFFTYNNTITGVKDGYNFTPLAGFSNVNKALVKGASMGAIVGNTYLRNADNKIVIGDDGFPLTGTPEVIGDAVPDFVMKMSNNFFWKRFELALDWEWKKGGETWNGTQATLDYYGRSAISGQQRTITSFVFDGVTQDGHINTMPVSFYDPALPVLNNRWTRYGPGGVAEAYVQKTDYLKLNAIQLSYKVPVKRPLQQLTLSAYINNLFLWSAYKGADPAQLLYDQPNTTGLDFFNLPSVKTYGFNVSLQF